MQPESAKAERSATRFFDVLRDVFVGAPIVGQSGFINLMRIKSRYYTDGVFPKLKRDIEAALKLFEGHDRNPSSDFGSCPRTQSFRQELFDKLYDFFHRYFSPSGSTYVRHAPEYRRLVRLTSLVEGR